VTLTEPLGGRKHFEHRREHLLFVELRMAQPHTVNGQFAEHVA
jgi:hypothetical protein